MKVYFYDKETKEFTAEAEARKDPRASERLGKDVWLLPANATFDVPPVKESGKAVVFDNGWKQIADNRGKDIVKTDGTVVVVNYLGDLKDGDKLISAQKKAGLEDGSLIYKGGNIIPKPALTDDEISATRERLYESTSDPNKNVVIVEVQDTDTRPVSYYASLSIPEEIVDRGSAPVHKGIVWFDNVVSAVRTNMMDIRMAEKSVDAIITNPQGAFNIQMVKWTGNPDAYTTKIITDNVNSSKMFTVPDDAVNVAFLLTPIEVANPMEVSVHGFTIVVENPRTVWVVKGFKTVEEKQMSWRNDKVTTWTPLEGLQSYRFSGTDTPNKLPIGKLKEGSIPADLIPWKVKEGKDTGVENDWAFYADANIEVDAVVNLRVNTLGEVVYFFLTNNGKEIQGSRVSVTMSENTIDNALKVPTMKAKVSNGDLIGWSFQSTTKDGAWLETDSVANPLATVTIRTEGAI